MKSGFPSLSIITPSYNQAEFLEYTIQSVLDQNYPNLEYIIVDGGSTDGSVEIIKRYEKHLSYWHSAPDNGQSAAINTGIRRATGEWVAWQNSDDFYYSDAFNAFARKANKCPDADLIVGNMMLVDKQGNELRDVCYVRPTHKSLLAEGMVLSNQAAFWRRDIHKNIGYLREDIVCSFDYEWFLRLTESHRKCCHINNILGAFRLHDESKTNQITDQFRRDHEIILSGWKPSRWQIRQSQLRRMFLLLAQGKFGYVFRGIFQRFFGVERKQ